MNLPGTIRSLWRHSAWADEELLKALRASGGEPAEALREYAHVLGAEEVWLARLEGREPRAAVWPEASLPEVERLAEGARAACRVFLDGLRDEDLEAEVTYRNSAGREFTNKVADVLLHVALHGQYHRGKVNVLLRQAGHQPAPVDFIAHVRGAPAATEADVSAGTRR